MSIVISRIGTLEGVRVLDLYAGSGAFGIEALSRGAAHVTFVERGRKAAEAIRKNLKTLSVDADQANVVVADAARAHADALVAGPVALLFADPPYRIDAAEVSRILEDLTSSGGLEPGALVVYEHAAGTEMCWPEGFDGGPARAYGDTAVSLGVYEGGS